MQGEQPSSLTPYAHFPRFPWQSFRPCSSSEASPGPCQHGCALYEVAQEKQAGAGASFWLGEAQCCGYRVLYPEGSIGSLQLPNPLVKHRGVKQERGRHIPLLSSPSMNSSIDCDWVISMGRWYPMWMEVTAASQKKGNSELAPPRKRGEQSPDPAWTYFVFCNGQAPSPRSPGCSSRWAGNPEKPCKCSANGGDATQDQSVRSQKPPMTNEMCKEKSRPRHKTESLLLPISLHWNKHKIHFC